MNSRRSIPEAGLWQVRSDWTELGASDPLWAVLVSPEHRHGKWDTDEFFATDGR